METYRGAGTDCVRRWSGGEQQRNLRVCILEGGESARQLAHEVLASQTGLHMRQHRGDGEQPAVASVCAHDWNDFDPAVDLPGMVVSAVIAEPWFRGVGQSWGPAAVVQMREMVRSLGRRSQCRKVSLCWPLPVIPATGTVMACAVECSELWTGQQPLDHTSGFDLRAFNVLHSLHENIVGVPLWAHSVSPGDTFGSLNLWFSQFLAVLTV